MYLIEFIGLQGSGKSTLNKYFANIAKSKGLPIYSVDRIIREKELIYNGKIISAIDTVIKFTAPRNYFSRWRGKIYGSVYLPYSKLAFFEQHPFVMELLSKSLQNDKNPIDLKTKSFQHKCNNYGKWWLAENILSDNDGYVLEEGLIYTGIELCIDHQDNCDFNFLRKYLDTIQLPQALVYIDLPHETCFRLLKNRKNMGPLNKARLMNLQKLTRKKISEYYKKNEEKLKIVCDETAKMGVEVIKINNADDKSPYDVAMDLFNRLPGIKNNFGAPK